MTTRPRSTTAAARLAGAAIAVSAIAGVTSVVGLHTSAAGQDRATGTANSRIAADTGCSQATRMFQLRADGRELWMNSVLRADSTSPQVYAWRKVYTFSASRKALAVASLRPEGDVERLLVSDADGGLRAYSYNVAARSMSVRDLTGDGVAKRYAFQRMAWDGKRLYGNRGRDLFVMSGVSTQEVPRAMMRVEGWNGFSRSFFATGDPDAELGWTNHEGVLRTSDVDISSGRWTVTTRAAANGFPQFSVTSPGGGILLRQLGNGMLWRHQFDPRDGTVGPHKTLATGTSAPDAPTTAGQVCEQQDTNGLPSAPATNPYPVEHTNGVTWTRRAEFVNDQIDSRFDEIACMTYDDNSGGGDHATGNALDCNSGTYREMPSASERAEMQRLADWVVRYHAPLKVRYVIWEQRIWHINTGRWDDMEDRGDLTQNHYDHVHISVSN